MIKRPLGTICVLIILVQVLLALAGVWGKPNVPAELKEGGSVLAAGQVYRKDARPDYQILYLKDAEVLHQNSVIAQLNMVIYDKEFKEISLGNKVSVAGECEMFEEPRNPGNFDRKFYYDKQDVSLMIFADHTELVSNGTWKVHESLFKLRERWNEILIRVLGERDGGMLSAMILGEKNGLDREWKEIYQISGIGHLLAISGLHLTFIGLLFYRVLRRTGLSYTIAGGCGILFLILYAVMTGMSVSTMRALIMFMIRIGADMCGRVYDMMTALLVAAMVILCTEPLYVFDAGFLLSFGAILGILLLLPLFKNIFECKLGFMEGFYASAAIQLFLFPVTIYNFFEIPMYSVVLNIIVIPLMSLVLGAGLLGSAIYCVFPWAGEMILKSAGLVFHLYDLLCQWGLSIPAARCVIGKPKWQQVAVCYIFLFVFILYMEKMLSKKEKNMTKWKKCGCCLLLGFILCISIPWKWNHGKVSITMLDVGQGDGIYMRGPAGLNYFVDGGSSDVKNVGKYRIEPFLKSQGVGVLDYVFISHGDGDHISGIEEMLERQKVGIQIKTIVLPVQEVWDESLEHLAKTAKANGTKVVVMDKGQKIREKSVFGEGDFSISCLHPGEEYSGVDGNAASMVLKVKYGEFDMLFTGDVEEEGEEALVENGDLGEMDVLKVAHHGSKNSTTDEFLALVKPRIGMISAGRDNAYGHPNSETLERLKSAGVKVYNTQADGAITIETDGKEMEIAKFISNYL